MDHYELLGVGRAALTEPIREAGRRKRIEFEARGGRPNDLERIDDALRVLPEAIHGTVHSQSSSGGAMA